MPLGGLLPYPEGGPNAGQAPPQAVAGPAGPPAPGMQGGGQDPDELKQMLRSAVEQLKQVAASNGIDWSEIA